MSNENNLKETAQKLQEPEIKVQETTEKKVCACSMGKIPCLLFLFLLTCGAFAYYYYIFPSPGYSCCPHEKSTEKASNITETILQKTETWLKPLFENKKSRLQELPQEFTELKELLEFVYYRMDSYLHSPQANKSKILEELKEVLIKTIKKETTEWIESRLLHFKIDLNQSQENLQKFSNDVCTYSCIVYKKAIPILQDILKEKK